MSIEFRVDRSDHRVVEKYLETRPTRVGAVLVEVTHLTRQHDAIDAAKKAGLEVVVETLTERLAYPGLVRTGLDYFSGAPLSAEQLATGPDRTEFVKRVIEPQLDAATVAVPPHFFAEREEQLDLNLDLVARTAGLVADRPIRAVMTVPRSLFRLVSPSVVAERYRLAGVAEWGERFAGVRLCPLRSPSAAAVLLADGTPTGGLHILGGVS